MCGRGIIFPWSCLCCYPLSGLLYITLSPLSSLSMPSGWLSLDLITNSNIRTYRLSDLYKLRWLIKFVLFFIVGGIPFWFVLALRLRFPKGTDRLLLSICHQSIWKITNSFIRNHVWKKQHFRKSTNYIFTPIEYLLKSSSFRNMVHHLWNLVFLVGFCPILSS